MLKTKDLKKKKKLEDSHKKKKKRQVTYRERTNRAVDLSSKTMEARRQWNNIF